MSKLREALKKAGDARSAAGPSPLGWIQEATADLQAERAGPSGADAGEVNPTYSRTRTENVDRGSLVRNRVLSVLHAGEVPDQVKLLRTQVLRGLAVLGGNSVLVTSAQPREGKSFTAANLAVSIAQEVNRTALLVDANLRDPSVHKNFGLSSPPGLTDYLLGNAEIPELLVHPGIPRLTVLPAGPALFNTSELLGSPRMASLMAEMKGRYPERVLVFDGSSLLVSADALVFTSQIDAVLLVVEAERTRRKDLARALELLGDKPLLGTVYNKSRDGV